MGDNMEGAFELIESMLMWRQRSADGNRCSKGLFLIILKNSYQCKRTCNNLFYFKGSTAQFLDV